MHDETLELLVRVGQPPSQDVLQASEEGQDVQAVEGEAAVEGQQVASGVDGARGRVGHHVAVDGAVQGRCRQTSSCTVHRVSPRVSGGRLPAALSASSLFGHVTLMSDAIMV